MIELLPDNMGTWCATVYDENGNSIDEFHNHTNALDALNTAASQYPFATYVPEEERDGQ